LLLDHGKRDHHWLSRSDWPWCFAVRSDQHWCFGGFQTVIGVLR